MGAGENLRDQLPDCLRGSRTHIRSLAKSSGLGASADSLPSVALAKEGVSNTQWRLAIWRMHMIRKHLLLSPGWTVAALAAHLEVGDKTLRRDMEFMRDFLGYEFHYDGSSRTWTGTGPNYRIL